MRTLSCTGLPAPANLGGLPSLSGSRWMRRMFSSRDTTFQALPAKRMPCPSFRGSVMGSCPMKRPSCMSPNSVAVRKEVAKSEVSTSSLPFGARRISRSPSFLQTRSFFARPCKSLANLSWGTLKGPVLHKSRQSTDGQTPPYCPRTARICWTRVE